MINDQASFSSAYDLEVKPTMLPKSQLSIQANPNVRTHHHHYHGNNCNHEKCRHGFSVIEVLTSIVVAMIGVLGVMILVPFAIRQAQTGLDVEASSVVARNASELFEIGGYRNRSNWIVSPDPTDPTTLVPANFPGIPIQPYSIDPLGLTDATGMANYAAAAFPFNLDPNSAAVYPGNLRIQAANLRLPLAGVAQFQRGDAVRMFRARDDLIFGEAIDSAPGTNDATFNGPTQIFDVVAGSGVPVRRQSAGLFSWSAIVVPDVAASLNTYRLHVLVYKNRITDPTVEDTVPINFSNSPHMRAARVVTPVDWASPVSTVQFDDPALTLFPPGSIKSDDWAMLINRRMVGGVPGPFQVGFYRIVNHRGVNLTLNGPDFNFNLADYTPTFVVHLKNVVGVYERTIAPESSSNWNSTF